jgi:hypothetical protein
MLAAVVALLEMLFVGAFVFLDAVASCYVEQVFGDDVTGEWSSGVPGGFAVCGRALRRRATLRRCVRLRAAGAGVAVARPRPELGTVRRRERGCQLVVL